MLRGLTTSTFAAEDLDAAARWYADLFGVEPYFQQPGYVEFRIGDYQHEFGIIDAAYANGRASGPVGAVVYWHVDDVEAAVARLVAQGATVHEPVREFGEGFVAASVVDPFGNLLGVMYNQHYLDVLTSSDGQRP